MATEDLGEGGRKEGDQFVPPEDGTSGATKIGVGAVIFAFIAAAFIFLHHR